MKYAAIDAVRMICNLSALSNSFEKKSCMVVSKIEFVMRGWRGGGSELISDSAVLWLFALSFKTDFNTQRYHLIILVWLEYKIPSEIEVGPRYQLALQLTLQQVATTTV